MGTKIEANAFLREDHSGIDLDGSASNGMMSFYHESRTVNNNENCSSLTSYDLEEVRQTMLEHELIFKDQLQELHRLYGRQQQLMNEIRRREINKDDVKVEKCQSSYLFPLNPGEDAKRPWNPNHSSSARSMAGCFPISGTSVSPFPPTQDKSCLRICEPRSLNGTYNLGMPADVYSRNVEKQQASYNRDYRFCLNDVQTSQHKAGSLTFDLCFKRNSSPREVSVSKQTDGVSDRLTLSRGEMCPDSSLNFSLVAKDCFHNSLDRRKGENSMSILRLRGESSGKEQLSDGYAEKGRFDRHSSVGGFCSGKPMTFPQSLLAEPKKELSFCPLDSGASVSRKRKKIFGVEIPEENDDPFDAASNKSCKFDQKPHDKNQRVFSLESSSWIASSFMKNLDLCRSNLNDGKSERPNAELTGEISSHKGFSDTSDMKGKWSEGCSAVGLNFVEMPNQHSESDPRKYSKNVDKMNIPAEILKKDLEHTQKFRQMIPQDIHNRGLPWFLRNSQVSDDLSKEKKNSYFMNLDSLQNCSNKFFGKAETPDDAIQTSKQKEETSASMVSHDPNGGTIEANDGTSANKILGFSISNALQGFKDLNSGENLSKVDSQKGLNNYISGLRHCIDLNLSLDEEDAPSVPSLPTAIVKIATTEIDLEAPAAFESERDASPQEAESKKKDILGEKSEFPSEEHDKVAAEAMIIVSLSTEKKSVDDNSLKWFAEIVSSQCGDSLDILVDVSKHRSPAREEGEDEEESVPDGMDYFEFMTLKLEDKGEKHYINDQLVLNNPTDDEAGPTQTKRPRRGQSRRGRQRKDFQRDILPGLITLSRLEVKEDFQAFEELLKAEGSTWQSGLSHRSSMRNGRGRKRSGGANTSPRIRTLCSAQAEQPICQLEQRSLAGWGKKTRRLPRQRCPNALLSFPVKC